MQCLDIATASIHNETESAILIDVRFSKNCDEHELMDLMKKLRSEKVSII